MGTRRQQRLHSHSKRSLVKEPSQYIYSHDAADSSFAISAKDILQMNEDGRTEHNMVSSCGE